MNVAPVVEVDPEQTILAGLLGAKGYKLAYVARIAGRSWTAVDNFVYGRTTPDPETLKRMTRTVNLLLRRNYTEERVLKMTRTKVTDDSDAIERGLLGGEDPE